MQLFFYFDGIHNTFSITAMEQPIIYENLLVTGGSFNFIGAFLFSRIFIPFCIFQYNNDVFAMRQLKYANNCANWHSKKCVIMAAAWYAILCNQFPRTYTYLYLHIYTYINVYVYIHIYIFVYLGRIFSFMQMLLRNNAYSALMIFSLLATLRKVDIILEENQCNKFTIVNIIIFAPNF